MTSLVWSEVWAKKTRHSRRADLREINLSLGSLPEPIAVLRPSAAGKMFRLETDLPIATRRAFDFPERLEPEVEGLVRRWLYLALLPAHDFEDGGGI